MCHENTVSLKQIASKPVKPTTLKTVVQKVCEIVSHSQEYAKEISANLGNGTAASAILSGASNRYPHDHFPLLVLTMAFQLHMIESPSSVISDRNDLEMSFDHINTLFRFTNLKQSVNRERWASIAIAMVPKILKGTKPSVAFDHAKRDITATDAPKNPRKNPPKSTKSFTTRNKNTRKAQTNVNTVKKGICPNYYSTGKCKFASKCIFKHGCHKCGKVHWPPCRVDNDG